MFCNVAVNIILANTVRTTWYGACHCGQEGTNFLLWPTRTTCLLVMLCTVDLAEPNKQV